METMGMDWSTIQTVAWTLIKIFALIVPLMLGVAYLTYAERKIIGWMQVRIGPNRVGFQGLLQPIADGLKLLMKEIIIPSGANKGLFILGPILAIAPALAAWAVIPFTDTLVLANINAGAAVCLGDHFDGRLRRDHRGLGVQLEIRLSRRDALGSTDRLVRDRHGFALVGVLMASQSLNLIDIVQGQSGGLHQWYIWPLFPLFLVYLISGVAETNRAPFDVAEGESEIVAGFHVEYSGMAFAVFFLAEYANMILIAALTTLMFLGGWLSPVTFLPDGILWWLLKTGFVLFLFLWFRATFPRYRYDQIMRLGWKVFIPITIVWIVVVGGMMQTPYGYLFH
jgi:NADH-quinone oxidoreductase subunit H